MRLYLHTSSLISTAVNGFRLPLMRQESTSQWPAFGNVKVPVQLGVMSRCPDALICESLFDEVWKKTVNITDPSLVYIAKLNSSEEAFGVTCLHGEQECAGNVQQLCVAKHEPSTWWEFIQCQNYEGREEIGLPDLALKCAKTVGFDWEDSKAGQCAGLDASGKSSEGVALLKESVTLAHDLGVKSSCTILINRKEVCVHDGTWKRCDNGYSVNDFVNQIIEEYDKLNQD